MNYTIAQTLSPKHFKRRFGVQRSTFRQMVNTRHPLWRPVPKLGAKPKLGIEARVLVALEYWREYRTYFHIGSSWGVSEASVCRIVHWVEDALMRSGRFRLPGKKQLLQDFAKPQVVMLDVTETPIERPQHRQQWFHSGKKKRHTLKCQLVVEPATGRILCTFFGKGRRHDFKLFQASGVHFHPQTQSLQDKGYQGMQKLHLNSCLPKKKPRGGQPSCEDKAYNRTLARDRVVIEQVNRCLKIFRILAECYRNRCRRFGLRCNLIAALYNYEQSQAQ
ncbi:IS5 family transposase [Trichocoleus sp. FACHB-591]|uniref:IS5 family transposase n=1 Tax=Trichocoleus sp. FACHB-591 TaxID=2692872 RepID=UPI001F54A76E|nr:IS5 family transposase [Trichocoleus sp. FACHB-591]